MARISNDTKRLGEKHRPTMEKTPNFKIWAKRYLACKDRIEEFEKAFNFITKEADNDEEIIQS